MKKVTKKFQRPPGIFFNAAFLSAAEKVALTEWLRGLHPIWEMRFSKNNPPPPNDHMRSLLRPVYWLGNWQFACLDYYHPPQGIENRAVRAESFPPLLQKLTSRIEEFCRQHYKHNDLPEKWRLNTCLINFYGELLIEGKWIDQARVGEHRDFEPGPVASLSLGEKAIFQFVSGKQNNQNNVAFQYSPGHGSLLIFAGDLAKNKLFHRVQRVEKKGDFLFTTPYQHFRCRRVNLTLRYVPDEHIVEYHQLPAIKKADTRQYVEELAAHSPFFSEILKREIADDLKI